MPDTIDKSAVAEVPASGATAETASRLGVSDREVAGLFDAVERQSLAMLDLHEQSLRFVLDRTQALIDCGDVCFEGGAALSRETLAASRNSLRMAVEDSAKLFRLWSEIATEAMTPFARLRMPAG